VTETEHILWQSDQSGFNFLVRIGYYIKGFWFLYTSLFIIPLVKKFENSSVGQIYVIAVLIFILHLMRGIFTWVKYYVYSVSLINDNKIKIKYFKYSKPKEIMVNKTDLRVESRKVDTMGKNEYKLIFYIKDKIKIKQYDSFYWKRDLQLEFIEILNNEKGE